MLKQGTFINKKYYSLLFFNLLTWSAFAINMMTDAILGGNQLGEVALKAVSIVAPIGSFVSFSRTFLLLAAESCMGYLLANLKRMRPIKLQGFPLFHPLLLGYLLV